VQRERDDDIYLSLTHTQSLPQEDEERRLGWGGTHTSLYLSISIEVGGRRKVGELGGMECVGK
jgi:hypothetical protein